MLKKSLFALSLFVFFVFSSCSNIVSGGESYGSSMTFALGDRAASSVFDAVSANEVVNDDSHLQVVCELLRGETAVSTESKTVPLKELKNTVFNLKNILYGNNYFVSLKIYFEDILIYRALSEDIKLDENNEQADINLPLQEEKSKIYYELNQGDFVTGTVKPLEYFINSDVILPEPERPLFNFDGWFLNSDCTGERITKLGKNKFVGDVTLYALWTGKDQIRNVNIIPSDTSKVDFGDKITLECETPDVTIYYTTNGDIPTENSNLYNPIDGIIVDDNILKDDKVNIKAFAVKNMMIPSGVAEKGYGLKRYTVKFNKGLYGKETVNDILGKKKGDIINLPKLTEPDFKLDGWLDNGTRFTDTYEVSKDITLTADWCEVNGVSSVTFTPSQTPDSSGSIDYKETVTLECTTPGAEIFYTTDNSSAKDSSTRKKYSSGNPIVIDKDMTIKAVAEKAGRTTSQEQSVAYKIRRYTVTFDRNGHGPASSQIQNLKKDDTLTEPEKLSDTGYIFGDWYKESSCKNKWDFNTDKIGTSNITLYAKWTPVTYKVVFHKNDGTSVETSEQTFTYDQSASLNANTFTKPNFGFAGWATTAEGPKVYDNEVTITTNLCDTANAEYHLYAVWIENKYTVVFNSNYAKSGVFEAAPVNQEFVYSTPNTLTANSFAKTGYTFKEWNTSADGSGTRYADGASVSELTSSGNFNLYAQWTPITYKVIFHKNDGTPVVTEETSEQTFTYDQSASLNANTFTNANFGFAGWATNAEGPKVYDNEVTITTNLCDTANAEYHLYAVWIENKYTVVFNSNYAKSGVVEAAPVKQEFVYSTPNTLTANSFAKTGYTFKEWNTSADGSGTGYADGTSVSELTSSGNFNLYAQWTPITYKVVFHKNDGTSASTEEKAEQSFTYDKSESLTTNSFTRPGFTFNGWATATDGAKTYDNEANISENLSSVANGEYHLYAVWVENKYTVVFNSNYAKSGVDEAAPVNQEFVYSTPNKLTANSFAKTGYTFKEWNTSANGSGTAYADGASVSELTSSGNFNLYAQWTPVTYKVIFHKNDGSAASTEQVFTYDQSKSLTTNTFTRSGFEFNGWATTAGGTKAYDDKATVSNLSSAANGIVDLYAHWNDVPPAIVTNFDVITGDRKLILKWTAPVDEDLAKVVISSRNLPSPLEITKGNSEATISNLTNGSEYEYTFEIKSVDNGGNENTITKAIIAIPNSITPNSTTANSINYGYWPQKQTTVNMADNKVRKVYNWDAYKGTDGAYYVKSGSNYYKLEEIQWSKLASNVYLSNVLLFAMASDGAIEYLNDTFKLRAFGPEADNLLKSTPAENGYHKVSLASHSQVTNTSDGFKAPSEPCSKRMKGRTKYAETTGIYLGDADTGYRSWWWLYDDGSRSTPNWVAQQGDSSWYKSDTYNKEGGIAPVIKLQ